MLDMNTVGENVKFTIVKQQIHCLCLGADNSRDLFLFYKNDLTIQEQYVL